jgi:hypothetical protein
LILEALQKCSLQHDVHIGILFTLSPLSAPFSSKENLYFFRASSERTGSGDM